MKRFLQLVTALWIVLLTGTTVLAQGLTVTGRVTSTDDGSPLPGVTILEKGSTNGTSSDAQGNYRITVGNNATLVFSFIGMTAQEVSVGNRSTIDVKMASDVSALSEVIVTGYTTQTQRQVTGSVAAVRGDQIARIPLATFDQALQGQVPGVLIQAQSGQPGASASVLIRGKGSILGSNSPLYILDGVEITASDFATLNQNDFESISVLKDAASTSQYGSRGAAGVIVITSKKGKAGRARLTYDFQSGFSRAPENKLRLMNTEEKLSYEMANGNPFEWEEADLTRLKSINTDWADVFFQTGRTNSHALSVSGATDKTSYFLSGSLFDQTGIVRTTGLKRYTGRVNVESTAGDFNFGINSTFGYSDFTNTSEDNTGISTPLNAIRWLNPYEKPYADDGKYSTIVSGQPNAFQELLENRNLRQQIKGVGNVFVGYNVPFVKGLSLRTSWGGDFTGNERSLFIDPTTQLGRGQLGNRGSFSRFYGKRFRYTGTSSISYTRQFGSEHTLTAGLYNEIIKNSANSFFYTGYGLGGPFENEAGITPGNATNGFIPAVGGAETDGFNPEDRLFRGGKNALLSYFAIINYGFRNRYFLTLGARTDGSSRFGENNRFANFGSIGASWIVSEEDFMAGLKSSVFNELKFKVSYGSAGNQAGIGSYQARELYGRGVYNGVSGLQQTQLANPDLRWEKRTTFNTGVEMAAFNGRVNATFEFYNSLTTDLFQGKPLSLTTGYTGLTSNVGKLRNRGVELFLNSDILKIGDFTWNVNANLSYNRNQIVQLEGGKNEIISGLTILRVGESINSIYVVPYAGVNPDNGNPRFINRQGEVTESYNPDDRVIVGSYEAPYFGGFGSALKFKGFEVSGLFSFVAGNKIYNNDRTNVENPAYLTDNLAASLLTEWRKPGDITQIPSPEATFRESTTHFVEKGDFLRLRNVNVSYSLPVNLINRAKLSSVRLFAQGQNLLTFTQFLGFDPEISTGSLSGAQYPALRTVTFGISLGL
jgi:TonB-linked SusC/RagA family outer membrane protein